MKPFTILTATAAPLPMANVDTDMIIPKQFLTTIERTGLGKSLFFDLRYDEAGKEKPDFVLNRAPYRQAEILVAGPNFGCGSSREHAPWALLDFGIRGVIAPGYADIFYNNSFKNGILPVILPPEQVELLMKEAQAQKKITIDLVAQAVKTEVGQSFPFTLDPFRRHCLLNGLDDIGLTLEKAGKIDSYENDLARDRPWLIKKAS